MDTGRHDMETLEVTICNFETGEITVRPMTENEIAEMQMTSNAEMQTMKEETPE